MIELVVYGGCILAVTGLFLLLHSTDEERQDFVDKYVKEVEFDITMKTL